MASSATGREPGSDSATDMIGPGGYPQEWVITGAEVREAYLVAVQFGDGATAIVDLSGYLDGPLFEPLREAQFFIRGAFDPESGTIAWPNGADFAPEFLRQLAAPELRGGKLARKARST